MFFSPHTVHTSTLLKNHMVFFFILQALGHSLQNNQSNKISISNCNPFYHLKSLEFSFLQPQITDILKQISSSWGKAIPAMEYFLDFSLFLPCEIYCTPFPIELDRVLVIGSTIRSENTPVKDTDLSSICPASHANEMPSCLFLFLGFLVDWVFMFVCVLRPWWDLAFTWHFIQV